MLDLDERPGTAPAVNTTDNDLIHIVCCNTDLTLCGLNVAGAPYVDGDVDEDDDELCSTCRLAWDTFGRCSHPLCPHGDGEDHD